MSALPAWFVPAVAFCFAAAIFIAARSLGEVAAQTFARYQERYLSGSRRELSEMFLFVAPQTLGRLGVALMALGAAFTFIVGPTLGVILAAAGLLSPPLLVRFYKDRRRKQFEQQLPDALTAMAGAMRSGLTFRQAMSEASNTGAQPLAQEFALFGRELQLGTELPEALNQLGARVQSEELDLFVSAAQISLKAGANMAEMLDALAATVRERFRLEGRILTLTAQGKLQGWVIGSLPLFVWIGFDWIRPDLTRPMLHHWFGAALIAVVILMETSGALLIRRIVKIEL